MGGDRFVRVEDVADAVEPADVVEPADAPLPFRRVLERCRRARLGPSS